MVKKIKKNCNGLFLRFPITCREDHLIVNFNHMFVFISYLSRKTHIPIKENLGWYVKPYGTETCFALFGTRL